MYQWLVFLHILGALLFFMAHGASAFMAFRLRRETQLERIRAILDLSNVAIPVAYMSLLLLLLAGIIAGIVGGWFRMGWIWAALVLLFVLAGGMIYYARRFYTPVRKAVGLPYREGRDMPALPPASETEIARLTQATNPMALGGFSFAVVAVILWLMVFKPF